MSYLKTNPVQALRRILRDHYHFPAIIKELIQNADDAKARRLHIAWTSDWRAAAHPLLTSPALLVLNDGEFRKADAKAICHLDEGSKGDDLTAIGKYGLGMKSVFHLCEAFFFVASPDQPAANGRPFIDILNPWPEGSPHDSWNNLTGASPGVFQRLASWDHGCDRWFCVVIPLRTPAQLAGSEPIVQGQFPSIAEFRKEHNDLQLVRYLPLLRSLSEVAVWDWDEQQRTFALKSRIMAEEARREPCSFPRVGRGERKRIYTKFLLENPENSKNSTSALAVGVESLLADDRFRGLKTDPRWPKNLTINPATGVSEDHSEKAEPHCAAVFSAYPATRGRLDVDMAVFLPLSKRIFDAVECSGTAAYQLLLHGQFFLDAGRRELYQTDGTNDGVQAEWNGLLLNEGALPLVIPALDAFRLAAGLSDTEIEGLTRALERSSLVGKYREHICRQSNWIWRLTFDESQIGAWTSAPAHEGFLELPQVATEEVSDYARLFPALPALIRRVAVTLQDKPRLVASNPPNWSGAPDYLDALLSSISPDVLSDGKHLRLLASFLDRCRDTLPTGSKRILIEKVASAIANYGIGRFRESLDAFRGVLMALGPSSWVRLGSVDRDAEPIFRDLNRLSLGVLVLPHDLAPQHSLASKLEIEAAKKVLAWLEQTATQRPTARTAAVAIRVAESTEGSQQVRVEALGAFRVFLIRDAGGREELVSWDTLCQLATEKRLFAGRSDYLVALQKALQGVSAYSLFAPVDSQPFRSLLDLAESPSCTRHACVEFLCQRKPALGTLVDRLDLLDRLIGGLEGLPSREHLMAVRYLIHSSREHCDDVDTSLLARSNLSVGGTIGKIAECALRRLGSEWRWVPDAVYERLSPSQLREFRIEAVGAEVLESLLAESGVDWLAASSLNPDEITVLLVQIQDPDLWRRMPLHETVGGDRVALTGRHAYIQSDAGQAVPTTLSSAVTILRRPHDIGLFTKYMDFRVRSWDDVAAIHVALSQPEPQRFAGDVLDAVDRLVCGSGSLSQETLTLLRETPWVPSGPRVVAPEQVVSLREAEDELRRLVSDVALQPGLVCHFQLDPLVTEHPSFGKLRQRQVFPDRDGSLAVLGDRLKGLPRYSLGDLMEVADADSMRALLCAFDGKADAVLPGLRVLSVLTRLYPESGSVILGAILPAVRGVLDIDVLQQCLHALSERHEAATRQDRKTCEEVFRWYLRQLLGARGFSRDCLRPVRLLNRAGSWKSPTHLCLAAEGIDRTDLLDGEQATLFPRVQSAVISEEEVSPEHSEKACDYADASSLVQYCRQWEGLVPRPLLGAFLSLLGDQPELREAANEYLPPHSLEFVRGQIEWPVYQGTMTTGADEDIWTSMGKQRFIVRFGDAHTRARVPNLVGGVFAAKVGDDISSVFIGDLFFTRLRVSQPPYRTKPITVRTFDVAALSVEQRKSVLFESARCLLDKVYNRRPTNLEALWRVLSDTGQFELEIVQEQLLQSSWFYFQQLGHARLPNLRDLTRRHDALTDRQVELRHRVSQANATEATAIENELRKLVPQLRTLLEGDAQVQQNTLAAVRKKMEDYEYSVGSIPFELFQNGDDAAAELAEMVADQPMPPGLDTIILQLEHGVFRLMHWGRPINEFRRADFVSDKGRERGYHNDLKKMLILTASDKTERSQVVTGKFGLGFKTVFFVSDRPIVVSGDLGFEVIGGFYPRRLAEPVLHRVREALAQEMPTRTDGTAIELPLHERSLTDLGGAMTRAQQLLPVMLAFARQVKCCHVKGLSNVQARARWREKSVLGLASVATGVFEGQDGIRTPVATRALLLRDNARGVIFFSLDASGLKALPDDVPTFWVTAPTTEYRRAGFAINAAFSLDVGRKQLADSDENACAGRVLGQAAGEALVALYDQSLQWSTLSQELGFTAEVSTKDFWCSLWDLLASARVNDDPILRTVIWERGAGMARLAADRPAIPSGLSGEYDTLTQRDHITHAVRGLLDEDSDLFMAVCGWPDFTSLCRPAGTVSDSRVFSFLRSALGNDAPQARTVALADAVRRALGDDVEVPATLAAKLGTVLTRETFKKWSESDTGRRECDACRELLKGLVFRNQGGMLSAPRVLLVPSRGGDEALKGAFAPSKHLLHESYTGAALEFFLLCRTELHAPASTLAEWAIDAVADTARKAALDYLYRGESRAGMAEYLRHHKAGTWLDNPASGLLAGRQECDQAQILAALGASFKEIAHFSGTVQYSMTELQSPQEVLKAINEWWRGCRGERLKHYDRQLYTDGRVPNLSTGELSTAESRAGWLKLFLLGLLQTVGWTSDERNRQFVTDCERRGWIDALSMVKSEPDLWLRKLDEFIEQQVSEITYFQSMKQLLGLFVIARRLDEYVDAFLAIDRVTDAFPLTSITKPRTSAFFQGGGPDAPPISEVLGIGQCFVMRELVRHKVIRNPQAYPYCYVPVKRLRQLMQCFDPELNLEDDRGSRWERSRAIHRCLHGYLSEAATFEGAFDIPLRVVAEDRALWRQLLGQEYPEEDLDGDR